MGLRQVNVTSPSPPLASRSSGIRGRFCANEAATTPKVSTTSAAAARHGAPRRAGRGHRPGTTASGAADAALGAGPVRTTPPSVRMSALTPSPSRSRAERTSRCRPHAVTGSVLSLEKGTMNGGWRASNASGPHCIRLRRAGGLRGHREQRPHCRAARARPRTQRIACEGYRMALRRPRASAGAARRRAGRWPRSARSDCRLYGLAEGVIRHPTHGSGHPSCRITLRSSTYGLPFPLSPAPPRVSQFAKQDDQSR